MRFIFSPPLDFSQALPESRIVFANADSLSEALQSLIVRTPLGTTLSSYELSQIDADILDRAFFLSEVAKAEIVQAFYDELTKLVAGETDYASARLAIKDKLAELEYDAGADTGTIRDLGSDARINLTLNMGAAGAQGYGNYRERQNPVILDQWPAQELVRIGPRKKRRNWDGREAGDPYATAAGRWRDAGGKMPDGRMVALVNDAIWKRISRFGKPYPPFDYNSGMGVKAVDRDTAIRLGLIDRDTQVAPDAQSFNEDFQVTPDVREQALRSVLEEDGYQFEGDVLTMGENQ